MSRQISPPSQFAIDTLNGFLQTHSGLMLKQRKEWTEIITKFETKNKYEILDPMGQTIGAMAEVSGGFKGHLIRLITRSHRPLDISIVDQNVKLVARLQRKFFWFFSDLNIFASDGSFIGSIHRRFGIFHKKYDLMDNNQFIFAQIKSSIFRLWTFKIFDLRGRQVGVISKKWQGFLKEGFTDADMFGVDLSHSEWDAVKKLIVFCAAISIDFDFFEENQGLRGGD